MMTSKNLFFELLKVSVGAKDSLSEKCSDQTWKKALETAVQQTIAGILLTGIERLPKEQYPPRNVLLQWIQITMSIEANSRKVTNAGEQAVSFFRRNGFPCEILKGASVARYYPEPLRRASGDIDIWADGGRKKIYEFARKFDKNGRLHGVTYHHISLPLFENIVVEVHIWPSFLYSPFLNHRLHRFFSLHTPDMSSDMPSLAFDRVFILLHCYLHMTSGGVGLRQITDYYYVLNQGFTEAEKEDSARWLRRLKMDRFAGGVMWILSEVYGMSSERLLLEPDEKEGKFILGEILLTGNMGRSDKRKWGPRRTAFQRMISNIRHDFHLMWHYPHESLWHPFFSLWVYFWRLSKGLAGDDD